MSPGADPQRTPLYDAHQELGAKIVDFHGFLMPVQYGGIQEEHRTVRTAAGLFDISHMGELEVWGDGAFDLVQKVTTNDVSALSTHQVQYSGLCYEHGGLVDDLTVYRLPDHYLLVVNASNIEKDFEWIERHLAGDVELKDRSDDYGLLALQGPASEEILQPLTETTLEKVGLYWSAPGRVAGEKALISRTGYTGEDGFEIYIEGADATRKVWDALMEAGRPAGMVPVGLGARDTLRLEVAYNLYGNDIWEETSPLEARMGWVVKMEKGDFLGRDALQKQTEEGIRRRLVGLQFEGRVFPRNGYPIMEGDKEIGMITSGTVGPSTGTPIALGYVPTDRAETGTVLTVDCRGREALATVVKLPFYREGSRR